MQEHIFWHHRSCLQRSPVMAFRFENMQEVYFTGTNTRMGSLITFEAKGAEGNLAKLEQIQETFVNLVLENVLELTESGATFYD